MAAPDVGSWVRTGLWALPLYGLLTCDNSVGASGGRTPGHRELASPFLRCAGRVESGL
jgi:hypothetical protein